MHKKFFRTMRYFTVSFLILFLLFDFVACSNVQSKDNAPRQDISDRNVRTDNGITLKKMKASEIIRLINKGKKVAITNAIIEGSLHFGETDNYVLTSPSQITVDIPQDLFFANCVFLDTVDTEVKNEDISKEGKNNYSQKVRFGGNLCFFDCDFRSDLNLRNSIVRGEINFSKSIFNGNVCMNQILIEGVDNQLYEINAKKEFSFVNATVRGNLNFMDANFEEDAIFSSTTLHNATFSNSNVKGNFTFSQTETQGFFICNYATFEGNTSLAFARFSGRFNMNHCSFFKSFTIERTLFMGETKLNHSVFKAEIETANTLFLQTPQMQEIEKSTPDPIAVDVKSSNTIILNP